MNRRGFISQLAGILAGATAPGLFLSEALDRFHWKAPPGQLIAVPNPEWINAPYEIKFLNCVEIPGDDSRGTTGFREMTYQIVSPLKFPARFATKKDVLACKNPVPPYILHQVLRL